MLLLRVEDSIEYISKGILFMRDIFLFGILLEPDLAGIREWIRIYTSLQCGKGFTTESLYIVYNHITILNLLSQIILFVNLFFIALTRATFWRL